jgi:hypothetical protein
LRAATLTTLLALLIACSSDDAETSESGSGASSLGCSDRDDMSSALLTSVQDCSSDADCILTPVDADCLEAFICPVPVNADTDLEGLEQDAQEIADRYEFSCRVCASANCAPPAGVRCDTASGRCQVVGISDHPDAG